MQILRAAASSSPVLSREAELNLTRSIVAAHHDAWSACLGVECVRATRRAVLLSTACDVAGRPNVLIPVDTTEVPLAEVANVAALARLTDPDQHILRALQALVLTDCDDTWTSPRASASSVRRTEAWRYKVLSSAATLRRLEERMVKHNIGPAMKHAHARVKSGVPVEDLIQEACVGLRRRPPLRPRARLFADIAVRYLTALGYEPYECASEDEARDRAEELIAQRKWPCYFFNSDTTGEKDFEEFFTDSEVLDMSRFESLGVIKNELVYEQAQLDHFLSVVADLKAKSLWEKVELVDLFNKMIPDFKHKETGKYLDGRM